MTGNDDLRQRLAAAERVCYLVGITGTDSATDRGKALTQAWMDWSHAYGRTAARLSDDDVLNLAARRDMIRNKTLVRLRADAQSTLEQQRGFTVWERQQ